MTPTPDRILPLLQKSWSLDTSRQWLPENPARGQCNVTALVVQDIFGGEILKTEAPGGWHFYNRVRGERYDLTSSQFAEPVPYADIISSREEAFAGTRPERHAVLRYRVESLLRDENSTAL